MNKLLLLLLVSSAASVWGMIKPPANLAGFKVARIVTNSVYLDITEGCPLESIDFFGQGASGLLGAAQQKLSKPAEGYRRIIKIPSSLVSLVEKNPDPFQSLIKNLFGKDRLSVGAVMDNNKEVLHTVSGDFAHALSTIIATEVAEKAEEDRKALEEALGQKEETLEREKEAALKKRDEVAGQTATQLGAQVTKNREDLAWWKSFGAPGIGVSAAALGATAMYYYMQAHYYLRAK